MEKDGRDGRKKEWRAKGIKELKMEGRKEGRKEPVCKVMCCFC